MPPSCSRRESSDRTMGQIQTSLNSVCGMYRLVKGHLIYFGVYHPPITAGRGASPFPSISGPRSHRPGLLGQTRGGDSWKLKSVAAAPSLPRASCLGTRPPAAPLPLCGGSCRSGLLQEVLAWVMEVPAVLRLDWESPRSRVQAEAGGCILSPRNLAESVLGRAWGGGGVVDAAPTPTSGYKTMRSQGRCPPRCHSGGCCGVRWVPRKPESKPQVHR